jgi:ABC-type transport system involved in multi-copper enzyme maturation permease subunit
MNTGPVREVAEREFRTVLRTQAAWVLAAGTVALVAVLTWLGKPGGYLPLVLDLVTPLEALVPVLAVAFGYRAILGDRDRGELETIRTYPLSAVEYVLGVYLGRAVALLGVLIAALAVAGALVPLTGERGLRTVSAHATVDTPLVFLRLLVVVAGFALVVLAVALLVSATARSARSGLVVATVLVAVIVVGLDTALVGGLTSGLLPTEATTVLTSLSPNSAFRSLVYGLAVAPLGAVDVPTGPGPFLAVLGLILWLGVALAGTTWLAWRG